MSITSSNLFSIKFLGVPVPRETQVDPSVLAFSLSLHQHPYIYVFPLSLALSINIKRGEKVRVYKKQIFPCISVVEHDVGSFNSQTQKVTDKVYFFFCRSK
jgi:hypothetical protein